MEIKIVFDEFDEAFEQNALVDCLNSTQDYFHFSVISFPLGMRGNTINVKAFYNEIEKYNFSDPLICLTMRRLNDNWFSHDSKGLSIISGYGYEVLGTEFSIRSFFVYQIAQSLIPIALGIDEYSLNDLCHEETRGCINDFCKNKTEIRHGIYRRSNFGQ
ncbi:MAG: hypothetical protein FWG42_02325 [Clostridiales bacterium]|nr:hypothetical protein [Clostridiales bacterium]